MEEKKSYQETPSPEVPISTQEYNNIFSLQNAILEMVVYQEDSQKILARLCEMAESFLPNSVASVMLKDEGSGLMNVVSAPNIPPSGHRALADLEPGPGRGSCANAVFSNEPQYVINTFEDERWGNVRHIAHDFNICSCWSMPIRNAQAEPVGSFALSSFEHRAPSYFHKKLMSTCAYTVNIVLKHKMMSEQINSHKAELKKQVKERTKELENAMAEIKSTQEHLIYTEKMALLGELVAGVTHEINTPLGVSITGATHLRDQMQILHKSISGNEGTIPLSKSELTNRLKNSIETAEMIFANLHRAASHISNFKDVAVDQSSNAKRSFNLHTYIQEVITSLHPEYRLYNIAFNVEGGEDLSLKSYPGVFGQLFCNLIINSLKHGLKPEEAHSINISYSVRNGILSIVYADDGIGVAPGLLKQLFEPFYTTKRSQGSTGLGLHIIRQLVTEKLKGEVKVENREPSGLQFTMKIPLEH